MSEIILIRQVDFDCTLMNIINKYGSLWNKTIVNPQSVDELRRVESGEIRSDLQ
jgi:hypothetical protein